VSSYIMMACLVRFRKLVKYYTECTNFTTQSNYFTTLAEWCGIY
jgi:hypothetical protein